MYGSIGGWMFNMYLKSFSNHGNKEASLMIRALLKSSDIMYRSVYNVSRPEDFDELRQNQNFLYSITKRLVIEALSDANSSRKSLASVLTSLDMSIEQITTAFVGIFQESVEPVSLTLTWALYHLARSPEVQEIFRKKIRKIISLSNYQPNLKRQRIPNRQYLEDPEIIEYFNKIIAETFRLNYPTIGLKRILQTSRIISGYSIPANTLVSTQNQLVGRMAKYFEDPLIFNPERRFEFKSMVLMPYGIGRVCGGAWFAKKIMLIALVNMVSSFEISYNYEDIGYINKLYNQPSRRIILTMKETKI
ncbi:hypothetical protein TNCT_34651 [Trichonephila clavata]|uniref:Cytochrome P450 n=1 Tax=Trichonephila clavata TaxID=2740835 RepID=A0A8X6KRC1_TRICU|nr:hypothetical protein TNCT_34651 [Trichonephila clavata]